MVGLENADDAGVYQLSEDTALIQTVDFFTPIVDDPYSFGAIAAANALSDVFAMGGVPLTAMNLVAFPLELLPSSVLAEIMRGGADKIAEAGAVLLGGHSIQDKEPKYGLAVTGIAHPAEIWSNAGARAGDELILTKPLGVGIITSALRKKRDKDGQVIMQHVVAPAVEKKAIEVMAQLNQVAARVARKVGVDACTDITGFGLLGHAWEMAQASHVRIELSLQAIPVIAGAKELALEGYIAGGNWANLEYMTDKTEFFNGIEMVQKNILADPITSGGLLLAVPAEKAGQLLTMLKQEGIAEAAIIGRVSAGEPRILVSP